LRIDTRSTAAKIDALDLPTELGPLRSVQAAVFARGAGASPTLYGQQRVGKAATPQLLVGARSGVVFVDPDGLNEPTLYRDTTIQSDLGFNRVIVWGDRLWACHGEAGLVSWRLGDVDGPIARIPIPADAPEIRSSSLSSGGKVHRASPRNLQPIDDEYAVYSLGRIVKFLHGDTATDLPTENSSEVIAIMPELTRLLVVRDDGSIDVLDRATRAFTSHTRGGGKIVASAALPWLGSVRLLLACDDGPIDCVGLDDSLVTRYTSNHRGLRVVTACPDQIAAISSDRQRLIIWRPWEQSPAMEIHVTAQVRHRIADVEYA
jgi:hypothetical protein